MRRQRQPAIGREPKIIGGRNFEAVDLTVAKDRAEQAAFGSRADGMRKAGKRNCGQAEQVELSTAIIDALPFGTIGDADGGNFPRRVLGATLAIRHRARGVSRVAKFDGAIDRSRPFARCHPAPLFQDDEHILDHAVFQRVGQLDRIAIGDIALRVRDSDVASRDDLARVPVPNDLVRTQAITRAEHPDIVERGDDVGVGIIFQTARAEAYLIGIGGRSLDRRGRRCDRRRLQILRTHRPGDERQRKCTTSQKVDTQHVFLPTHLRPARNIGVSSFPPVPLLAIALPITLCADPRNRLTLQRGGSWPKTSYLFFYVSSSKVRVYMQIDFVTAVPSDPAILALPVGQGPGDGSRWPGLEGEGAMLATVAAAAARFEGEAGATLELFIPDGAQPRRVILLGIGAGADTDWEKAGGALTAKLLTSGARDVVVDLGAAKTAPSAKAAARFAGAAAQRSWRYDIYRTKLADKKKPTLTTITIARAPSGIDQAWVDQDAVTKGMALTRRLVTAPPNALYPESFVEWVREEVEGLGLEITVLDEAAMRDLGMGALLGVSQGSQREGRLLALKVEWRGRRRSGLGARRQGRHVRFWRDFDQARRGYGGHEVGHGRRGRGRGCHEDACGA